jgi:hypothetical protein
MARTKLINADFFEFLFPFLKNQKKIKEKINAK